MIVKLFRLSCLLPLAFAFNSQCLAQRYNSIVISEIMADPTPVKALPDVEYLELYNRSDKNASLKGWRLVVGNRTVVLPDSVVAPGAYALLVSKSRVAEMSVYGKVVGLSSVSLANEGTSLSLYDNHNQLVFSMNYKDSWWPVEKRNGGYALEMIDVENPCGSQQNWSVSDDSAGGTPGKANSVAKDNPDLIAPFVEQIYLPAAVKIIVGFSERLDSLSAVSGAVVEISGKKIRSRELETPSFQSLVLTLDTPLLSGVQYELGIRNISDCSGNLLRDVKISIGMPAKAEQGDLVLNEILFNPLVNGADFVEIYNRSSRFLSLKNWSLGNTKNGQEDVFRIITDKDVFMAPHAFMALTTDAEALWQQYPTDKHRNFLVMESLPSFPISEGGAVLRNAEGKTVDRFVYNEKMHHALIINYKGVSLEQIDPEKYEHDDQNWHSAAGTAGYATPGYANSQARDSGDADDFTVEPEAFSPGNDGVDDFAKILYKQSSAGRIGSIRIYDINGRSVKDLIQNQLIGTSGEISWDGTDHQGNPVRTGYYLIRIDTFDIQGNKREYRKKVVVAAKW